MLLAGTEREGGAIFESTPSQLARKEWYDRLPKFVDSTLFSPLGKVALILWAESPHPVPRFCVRSDTTRDLLALEGLQQLDARAIQYDDCSSLRADVLQQAAVSVDDEPDEPEWSDRAKRILTAEGRRYFKLLGKTEKMCSPSLTT